MILIIFFFVNGKKICVRSNSQLLQKNKKKENFFLNNIWKR